MFFGHAVFPSSAEEGSSATTPRFSYRWFLSVYSPHFLKLPGTQQSHHPKVHTRRKNDGDRKTERSLHPVPCINAGDIHEHVNNCPHHKRGDHELRGRTDHFPQSKSSVAVPEDKHQHELSLIHISE